MNLFFKVIFFIFIQQIYLFSDNYKIEIPSDIITQADSSTPISINDHDEVLIQYNNKYALWKKNQPVEDIKNNSEYYYWQFHKLSNSGIVLGTGADTKQNKIVPVIWNSALGLQGINIYNDIHNIQPNGITPIDINSFNQIIGNYQTITGNKSSFIWDHGVAKELKLEDLKDQGYEPINIQVIAINDLGAILGSFQYGHLHPKKNKYIIEGERYFLWNGKTHVINIPENTVDFFYAREWENIQWKIVDLNNNNDVLIKYNYIKYTTNPNISSGYNKIYIWNPSNGLRIIPQETSQESEAIKFNDKLQFLIGDSYCSYVVYFDNKFIGFDVPLKELSRVNLEDINNRGTIVGSGTLWGETHFFILTRED